MTLATLSPDRNAHVAHPTLKARFAARFFLGLSPLLVFSPAFGQAPYVPPDADNDARPYPVVYRQNMGQVLDTEGDPRADIFYVSEGSNPMVWARHKSRVSLTMAARDTSLATPDALFRVDLYPGGKAAHQVDPVRTDTLPGHCNFYRPDIAPGITDVTATSRLIYEGIYDQIDWHLYGGRAGAKMALVCWPGSDPSDIIMHFDGLDSIDVDLVGDLKLFLAGRWITLREAVAYQVDSLGAVVPLNWGADYVLAGGLHAVTFQFDTYDQNLPLILQIGPEAGAAWEPDDPRNLLWCTYAGSNDADEFMAADVDTEGDVYVCGYAYQQNFPVETGTQFYSAQDAFLAGSEDAVVMKFRAVDKRIMWATFLGGTASGTGTLQWMGLDKAYDIAVYKGVEDAYKYAFVTGSTISTDFYVGRDVNSIFQNADETPNANTLGRHMAWLAAYTQLDGKLHWSTTHGAPDGDSWVTDGLAVDVFEDGTVVWGGRISENPADPLLWDYPHVTPSGAFTKAVGGGFFTLFDADYQVEWRTPFGSRALYGGLYDAKITRVGSANQKTAFITGTTVADDTDPDLWPLDVFQPSGSPGFFQPSPGGGGLDAYMARLNLETHQLEYSTYWGGNGVDRGIALEISRTTPHGFRNVWVGGLTKSTDLDGTQLPEVSGGFHQAVHGGDADGFVLTFETQPDVDLAYGTLYGGEGPDAVFDIDAARECNVISGTCKVFITGETASGQDMLVAASPLLYQQDMLGNVPVNDRRDAFVLALGQLTKEPIWATYIGGMGPDKGWGVAASESELFLAGGTASDHLTFPLKEFDTGSPLDWYDGDLSNNVGTSYGYYSFNANYYNNPFHGGPLQYDLWPGHSHDAFIASFAITTNLSVADNVPVPSALRAVLVDPEGVWAVLLPYPSRWTFRLSDMQGRLVERVEAVAGALGRMDLRGHAPGIYALTCTDQEGRALGTKLLKP